MARKTRLSFIRGMIVITATSLLIPGFTQNNGFPDIGSKILTRKAKYPPKTASNKPTKKAIAHGYVLNTARVRKKKRRDVNMTVAEKRKAVSLSDMTQTEVETVAEENERVMKQHCQVEGLSSRKYRPTRAVTAHPKPHNLWQ